MTVSIHPEDIERLAAQGLTTKQIADCLGVARSTLYNKMKQELDVMDAIKRGRAKGLADVANALFQSAVGGNVTAMIYYLKARDPKRWSDRRQTEITGKGGGPVELLPFKFVDPPASE